VGHKIDRICSWDS